MIVRRDISSIPFCSANETWQRIVELVTGPDSKDVQQLRDATGVLASIITDEHPASRAIQFEGVGAQLRIYCRYGMKAVENGGKVDPLTWNPTAGDWALWVPCDAENIEWVKDALLETSPRIKVFDVVSGERSEDEGAEKATASRRGDLVVDWNVE